MKTFAVAILLTKTVQEGWSQKTTTAMLLWAGDAHSQEEAKGKAIEQAFRENEGFGLSGSLVVEVAPSTETKTATS